MKNYTLFCASENSLVSRMSFKVFRQVGGGDELLVALVAPERPVSGVPKSVSVEMSFLDESFAANVARVTSVVVVSSLVFPQRRRRREARAAFQTRVGLRTGPVIENC